MATINYDKRVFGLDMFRAYAIINVVWTHGRLVSGDLLHNTFYFPWIDGVEIFFVISGFLIGTILINDIQKEETFNLSSISKFWKRRWFRTLPNYYLILLINYLLLKLSIIQGDLDAVNYQYFFFLQNFTIGDFGFYWESWSLSIEEWFYISLPLTIFIGLKFLSKRNAILLAIVLLISLPLIYRISISNIPTTSFYLWDINFRKVVITRLDAIGYGVLAAYIKFYYNEKWTNYHNIFFVFGLTICTLNFYFPTSKDTFFSKTFLLCIIPFGAMMMLPKFDSIKSFQQVFLGKVVTHISVISYSMYLVNLIVVVIIANYFPPKTDMEQAYMFIVYWMATILLSTLLYKFFEKPMMDLRDR